jgi:hypothetical protein
MPFKLFAADKDLQAWLGLDSGFFRRLFVDDGSFGTANALVLV